MSEDFRSEAPGPARALAWEEPRGWPQDAARDRVIGDWYLWQRKGGHRTSTDDVLTASFAVDRWVQRAPTRSPARYLDLGCGIASVLLMTAHRLSPVEVVGVEAQPQSVAMARRAVAELPPGAPPIEIVHSDFRDFVPGRADRHFDLITGSPPYFPVGSGVLPADAQRRACRFEARGGVEAYCECAAQWLAPEGRFAFVFQTTWDARALAAIGEAGLYLHARLDAKMRVGREQDFLTVYDVALHPPAEAVARERFAIRDADGAITADYLAARRRLGVA